MYLTVAGFIIKISFVPARDTYKVFAINKLKDTIATVLKRFICHKAVNKCDYAIEIHRHVPEVFHRKVKGKTIYFVCLFDEKKNTIVTYKHISINHFIFILLKVLSSLINQTDGCILHCSAVLYGGKLILFTGPTGAGKSTAASLLKDHFEVIADDMLVIKREKGRFYCYQVPVMEKNYTIVKTPRRYELGAVLIVRKASYFKVEKVQKSDQIISNLSNQLWSGGSALTHQLKFLFSLSTQFSHIYFLYFEKDKSKMLEYFDRFQQRQFPLRHVAKGSQTPGPQP